MYKYSHSLQPAAVNQQVTLVLHSCCVRLLIMCIRMQDNFDEWGPVERIYNVASKTIAFVQYYWRASAEFAKEAMQVITALNCIVASVCRVTT